MFTKSPHGEQHNSRLIFLFESPYLEITSTKQTLANKVLILENIIKVRFHLVRGPIMKKMAHVFYGFPQRTESNLLNATHP